MSRQGVPRRKGRHGGNAGVRRKGWGASEAIISLLGNVHCGIATERKNALAESHYPAAGVTAIVSPQGGIVPPGVASQTQSGTPGWGYDWWAFA